MRWICALVLLGLVGCRVLWPVEPMLPTSVGPALPILVNLEAEVLWPTVQLQVQEGPWATGVIVGWDGATARILSAAHVFEGYQERSVTIYVIEPAPWAFEANLVWRAGEVDLALLEGEPAPGLIPHVAPLYPHGGAAGVQRFNPVIGVGSRPGLQQLWPTAGWIAQVEPSALVTSITWFGASGGPIFVKQEGYWKVWAVTSGLSLTTGHGVSSWLTNIVYVVPVGGWVGDG